MIRKDCPICRGPSFSSSTHGKWTCPYCNEDLSKEPSKPADANLCGQHYLKLETDYRQLA